MGILPHPYRPGTKPF